MSAQQRVRFGCLFFSFLSSVFFESFNGCLNVFGDGFAVETLVCVRFAVEIADNLATAGLRI